MNKNYFDVFHDGMSALLRELSLDEVVLYLKNHIHSFILDETICFCFINRLSNLNETNQHPAAQRALVYLLDKALQLRPFRPGLLKAVVQMTGNPQVKIRLDIIESLKDSPEIYDQITGLDLKHDAEDALTFLGQLIQGHPRHVAAAQYALQIERSLGQMPGPWIDTFKCPKQIKQDWDIHLFNHHAAICKYEEAMNMWPTLDQGRMRETTLNLAAEMFIKSGDTAKGIELYSLSLGQDNRQTPVRLRLKELKKPFKANPTFLESRSVDICVYSWNKADILARTLESLSQTDIGSARVNILLNGCTDNSREVVDAALPLFPNNEVSIHELHVNIGAPAARNWLMRLPEVQKSDYIAFIDDDVIMQKDWLAQFLTLAETDDEIAAVGCKVVEPTTPPMYQYLFRHVAVADHGLFKLSIAAPPEQYDNGLYEFTRETRDVMGCQHLLRTSALNDIPAGFDIRFSPSQVDDIDHDIALCLKGYKVMFCGTVTCEHHQGSGIVRFKDQKEDAGRIGNAMGNDIKLFFKHFDHMSEVSALDNLSLPLGVDIPEI